MICGLDQIQLACIAVLAARDGPLDSIEIAARVSEIKPNPLDEYAGTAARVDVTRRALRALADLGLVCDMGRGFRGDRQLWATPDAARRSVGRGHAVYGKSGSHPFASKSRRPLGVRGH